MDIKNKIEEIIEKLKNDKGLMERFEKNPTSVIEEYIGIDLPDDQLNQVIDTIKAKIKISGIGDKLSNLFGKK